jgi:hypothetical protein
MVRWRRLQSKETHIYSHMKQAGDLQWHLHIISDTYIDTSLWIHTFTHYYWYIHLHIITDTYIYTLLLISTFTRQRGSWVSITNTMLTWFGEELGKFHSLFLTVSTLCLGYCLYSVPGAEWNEIWGFYCVCPLSTMGRFGVYRLDWYDARLFHFSLPDIKVTILKCIQYPVCLTSIAI